MTTYSKPSLEYPTTYLLVQAYQQLWLVNRYGVYQQFTSVTHTSQPSPSARCCYELLRFTSRLRAPV